MDPHLACTESLLYMSLKARGEEEKSGGSPVLLARERIENYVALGKQLSSKPRISLSCLRALVCALGGRASVHLHMTREQERFSGGWKPVSSPHTRRALKADVI